MIIESFNHSYPFKITSAGRYGIDYVFSSPYADYKVTIVDEHAMNPRKEVGLFEINFEKLDEDDPTEGKFSATNDNKDPAKILGTVIAIMKDVMHNNSQTFNAFVFSAANRERSRQKLYDTMVKTLASKLGFKHKIKDISDPFDGKKREYIIWKNKEPMHSPVNEMTEYNKTSVPRVISVFHGSNAKFKEFATKAKRVENDFFGGGIAYFTDDQKVALTYSRAMTRRYGGEEYLYKVDLNLSKIFDVDTVYTGAELQKFFAHIKPEAFARGAGLLKGGADKYSVLASLELGNAVMTGHDVFRGLSQGLVNSSGAEKILMKLGYDGLRYNGGDNMSAGKHNVYMPYYSKDITIRNTFKVNRRVIAESLDMPEIGYMTFSRELLPQIVDQDEFLDHLKLMGIDYTKVALNADDVKATQSDGFDMDKVAKMMNNKTLHPVLVSSDYFILDGHHRWIAAFNKKHTFSALLINAPILELIRIAADYYNTEYADYIMSEEFAPYEPDLEVLYGEIPERVPQVKPEVEPERIAETVSNIRKIINRQPRL